MRHVIYCADPLNPRRPDSDYEAEVETATRADLSIALIGFEDLLAGDAAGAVRRVRSPESQDLGVYRGWMLSPDHYAQLYDALAERGIRLINDPAAYRHCHWLPESYAVIEKWTPRTVWLERTALSASSIQERLEVFGTSPIVIKDYVKSRKHEWAEACFIPDASECGSAERVIARFRELQGDDLAGGLVFREFVALDPIGTHARSGMPLTREFRLFFLDGDILAAFPYWEGVDYGEIRPPEQPFAEIGRAVRSRFFTMDIAQRTDGAWIVVELGDGQVAGLPDTADPADFYAALATHLS